MIVRATEKDADTLTKIALTSKAHWSYSEEEIQNWKQDLAVTSDRIKSWNFFKYVDEDQILGFSGINYLSQQTILEFLFVLPKYMGKGIGSALLDHAIYKATENLSMSLIVLSDPNAQSFYEKYSFVKFKEEESSIVGRFLPWMIKVL